ncbi:MAG: 3-dehydroquinate synthase [Candidatus Firestonebacteria bacterium]|nr:3-dehydroquinate synthase [Candidatus Firestonebacteria bacterium]
MPQVWVRFHDQRDYPIIIEPGILPSVGAWARRRTTGRTALIVTHPRLLRLFGPAVKGSLQAAGFSVHVQCVPEGEKTKSLETLNRVIGVMLQARLDRRTLVVALGGGVIGDLAGLVAATFMRGVDFIQLPTTLLAQVDSSIGGKVAVNHALGKNMIGAFHQPRLVLIDPLVLKTLPLRQFRSGLAEVIKSAAIADDKLFSFLERQMPEILKKNSKILTQIIQKTCAIKARIVAQDEKEGGLRAILNYGHTVGHALEAYHHYNKTYLHGEAVSLGMLAAVRLAVSAGVADIRTQQRQEQILRQAGLPGQGQGEKIEEIINLMKFDKKAKDGNLNFVLTPKIGHARISNKLTPFSVRRAIKTVVSGSRTAEGNNGQR